VVQRACLTQSYSWYKASRLSIGLSILFSLGIYLFQSNGLQAVLADIPAMVDSNFLSSEVTPMEEENPSMPIRFMGKPKPKTSQNILLTDWTPSYAKYGGTHALWLDAHQNIQENLGKLEWILNIASQRKQAPELVIYMIPDRDFSQSSAGGFTSWESYLNANRLIAKRLHRFAQETKLTPKVYLEPDSLGGLVEKIMSEAYTTPKSPEALLQWDWEAGLSSSTKALIHARVTALKTLVKHYSTGDAMTEERAEAPHCKVYLDVGNSGWINTQEERLPWMALLVHLSGGLEAAGLTSNISNRFPLLQPETSWPMILTEQHYLARLKTWIGNTPDHPLEWVVDASRNGNTTRHGFLSKLLKGRPMPAPKRQFYLHPEGLLFDNDTPHGRWVGLWYQEDTSQPLHKAPQHTIHLIPFTGGSKVLYQLIQQERYEWLADRRLVLAPEWLDPVLDETPGMPPSDGLHKRFEPITHIRWIKPPDACDGALNCPPGASKSALWAFTAKTKAPVLLDPKVFIPNP
jgi:hypothetical protein